MFLFLGHLANSILVSLLIFLSLLDMGSVSIFFLLSPDPLHFQIIELYVRAICQCDSLRPYITVEMTKKGA